MADDNRRLPPGQTLTEKFPVLHYGGIPAFQKESWTFRLFGLVEEEKTFTYDGFMGLSQNEIVADFHCVTTWSRYDNTWEGVASSTIVDLCNVKASAKYVLIHCEQGYTTNLSLHDFLRKDVIFAHSHDGKALTPEHGFPLRLVVPHLYAWKSAKWVRGVEFIQDDKPGFWESNGYHNHGDPWTEERFS